MSQSRNPLENNTRQFALAVHDFGKALPLTVANVEDLKPLFRASGAIGAQYIAAAGAINRNDYLIGLRNGVLETRNTHYWLSLVGTQGHPELENRRMQLLQVAEDLARVFSRVMQSSNINS